MNLEVNHPPLEPSDKNIASAQTFTVTLAEPEEDRSRKPHSDS
jgi:hypothetical protein